MKFQQILCEETNTLNVSEHTGRGQRKGDREAEQWDLKIMICPLYLHTNQFKSLVAVKTNAINSWLILCCNCC